MVVDTLNYFNGDQLATDIFINKYALRVGGKILEKTPEDMHNRLSSEFARIESKYPNPLSKEQIFNLLDRFKYIVPQGSPMAGIGNDNQVTTLSNCYVIESPHDSYAGIFKTEQEMIQLMKRRGGVGFSIHSLRPREMPTGSVAIKSSGIVLFSERYSNGTREVAQDGRRGALMLSCSIEHPDVLDFIDAKLDLSKITGANISVMITDKFMEAVINNEDYEISFISNKGEFKSKLNAKKVWDKIIHNAWTSAEPGVLYWDTIVRESPVNVYGEEWMETSTNPCFTGDTIVAVADGRNGVSIKELAEIDKPFLVYSARENNSTGNRRKGWKTEIKTAIAFKTGYKKVIEVILSNGSSFKCTPEHLLALPDGEYVEAKDSLGLMLEKFYSFSNKNNDKSYRHINSKTNGYAKQYRMIFEYYNGSYDGKLYQIDHIDDNSKNDSISNLALLSVEDHNLKTKRTGADNPIHKITGTKYLSLFSKRSNIQANAKRYDWNDEVLENKLVEFDLKYGEELEKLRPKDINVDFSEDVFVENIVELGIEDVYDLTVEDNHNFYIITKADDENYLNSSGVLVHNCGEIPLCPYDSCRLLAINLYSYVDNAFMGRDKSRFNFDLFKSHVRIAQRLMDDIVDLEIEKIEKILNLIKNSNDPGEVKEVEYNVWSKILEKTVKGRRTGLGITGLGDTIAALGLTYGTPEATDISEQIIKTLSIESYKSSIELAKERGSFPIFDIDIDEESDFMKRMLSTLKENKEYETLSDYEKYGRRNIANLTIAPTGSVSTLTQTTSGIEPAFAVFYKRRRKTNDKSKATFTDSVGDLWEEYNVFHHKFVEWFRINVWNDLIHKSDIFAKLGDTPLECLQALSDDQINDYIKQSPYYKATSNDVDWVEKVRMQGNVQKFIDHSISVTVNIPNNTTQDVVEDIYMTGWKTGCKGMTIYRDGCRSGVLVSTAVTEKENDIKYIDAVKRPKTLECDIYHKVGAGEKWMIIVGLYNNKPYEVFALSDPDNSIFPQKIEKGRLTRVKSQHYKLEGEYGKRVHVINNIVDLMLDQEKNDTRRYSIQLRHGIKPLFISEQIDKFASISGFDKVIGRVLRLYAEGEKAKDKCPECNSNLTYQDGCVKCTNCSFSLCG